MKYSKTPKGNDMVKILKAISRDEELTRNNGKWVSFNRPHKNKKKYDRKQMKKEMSKTDISFLSFWHTVFTFF